MREKLARDLVINRFQNILIEDRRTFYTVIAGLVVLVSGFIFVICSEIALFVVGLR